jgi:hypothetical protein
MMETSGKPEHVDSDAMNVISAFRKASGSVWDQAVRMQRMMVNTVNTIMRVLPRRGIMPTVMHLQAFMTNSVYREDVIEGLTADDGNLLNTWMAFAAKSESQQNGEFESSINRIDKFLNNPIMRRIIAQPYLSLDFKELMDGGAIVLCKMNQKMGSENKSLLGALLVNFIFKTAMARGNLDISKRHPTGFYIDEFQTFVGGTGDELKAILAEARKMRLGLTMANQFFNQLPKDIQDAVANNTGTKIVFRTEPQDASMFEKLFLGQLSMEDFVGLNRYMAHCRLMAKSNIETVNTFTYPEPPIPKESDVKSNNRNLHQDTANRMGISLKAVVGQPKNAKEILGHVMRLAPTPAVSTAISTEIVRFLTSLSDEQFAEFQKIRKEWAYVQRELLLASPGYIPDKRKRLEQLSRLRVGVPSWEIDALIARLYQSIQGMVKAKDDQDVEMEDDFFDDLMPSKGGSAKQKQKSSKKDTESFDDLFDSFG